MSQWSSLMTFFAYWSAPDLDNFMIRNAQLRAVDNCLVFLCIIILLERFKSGSMLIIAFSILHCGIAPLSCISYLPVISRALCPSNLQLYLAILWYWLNDELRQFVQCGWIKTYILTDIKCMYRDFRRKSWRWARKTRGSGQLSGADILKPFLGALHSDLAQKRKGWSMTVHKQYVQYKIEKRAEKLYPNRADHDRILLPEHIRQSTCLVQKIAKLQKLSDPYHKKTFSFTTFAPRFLVTDAILYGKAYEDELNVLYRCHEL